MASTKSQLINRTQAIDILRSELLNRLDGNTSVCRYAAERGVMCHGFARWDDGELREHYKWIVRRQPRMSRKELEGIADRWQLSQLEVSELPTSCDVEARIHDMVSRLGRFLQRRSVALSPRDQRKEIHRPMSIRIRPVVHEDRDRLLAFYRSLSPESLHARFFEACSPDAALASSPVDVDRRNTVGVVAELGEQIAASLTISGSATQRKLLSPFAMIYRA